MGMNRSDADPKQHEIQALNGLRGLAAILVVMCHLQLPSTLLVMFPLIEPIKELGWFGVPIYFVLSGYLITWLALQEKQTTGDLSLRFFFLRRILRLWPIYILTCALGLWAWSFPSLDAISASPAWFIPLITFTTNFAISAHLEHFGVLGAYWTLALEEQFYVLGGFSLKRLSNDYLIILCSVLLILCFIWRLYPLPFSCFLHYRIQPPVSLSSIVLGCLLALVAPNITIYLEKLQSTFCFIVLLGLCLLAYFEWPFPESAKKCCLLMTSADFLALILVILAIGKTGLIHTILNFRPFIYLGKISLCMYAVNLPVIYFYYHYRVMFSFLLSAPDRHPVSAVFFDVLIIYFIIITISAAWQLIEKPIAQLRYQYRPSTKKQSFDHLLPILTSEIPSFFETESSPLARPVL
jgi:peptidoglycan/LPS O-acetylase OafA/YrhL